MLRNYIITAFRNLARNKANTLINIIGLSLGITCSLVMFLMAEYSNNYNTHHENYDKIYRIVTESDRATGDRDYTPGVPPPLPDALRSDYADITDLVYVSFFYGNHLMEIRNNNDQPVYFEENEGLGVTENQFFSIFTRPLLKGNSSKILTQPNEIVLSEKLAAKYFPDDEPIGKIIVLNKNRQLKVVGIMADYPHNSDFPFDAFISYPTFKERHLERGWGSTDSDDHVYMLIDNPQKAANLESQLSEFIAKYFPEPYDNKSLHVQPLSQLHHDDRYSNFSFRTVTEGQIMVMYIIGLFLLLTACINFVNLSTAVALRRSREVGIRKVLGSTRAQLVRQYLGETFLITLFSLVVGLGLAELAIIKMNTFLDIHLAINLLTDTTLQLYLVSLLVAVTLLSGLYPAFVLSGFSPVAALKGLITNRNSDKLSFRKSLVVFQFLISQVFIIGTIIVVMQLDFIKSADLGFATEGILDVPLPDNDLEKKKILQNELLSLSAVNKVSLAFSNPSSGSVSATHVRLGSGEEMYRTEIKYADNYYLDLFGIELLAGRNINQSDTINTMVVNEAFTKLTGHDNIRDILGKTVRFWSRDVEVVGVISDFHAKSLRDLKPPVIMTSNINSYRQASININMTNVSETVDLIKSKWQQIYPEYTFDYGFMDERLAEFYEGEEKMATIFTTFSGIAILIGCLGLFGLASFMINQKVKEIGVRKVLGASVQQVLILFSKEFFKLIVFAFILAAPMAYFGMQMWLQNFQYKITVGPMVFLVGILSTLTIAIATVGYKSMKAAVANPIDALRDE